MWTFKDLFLQYFMKFLYYTNKTEEQSVNLQEFFLIDHRALQQQDILMKIQCELAGSFCNFF